jgi:hypothetical protein
MTQQLFVTKKYGTYADTFLMLGLAQLVEYALKATNQKSAIQLLDQGTHYCLNLNSIIPILFHQSKVKRLTLAKYRRKLNVLTQWRKPKDENFIGSIYFNKKVNLNLMKMHQNHRIQVPKMA